jgi:prepilin-type processing-associated H-X9-DG protein
MRRLLDLPRRHLGRGVFAFYDGHGFWVASATGPWAGNVVGVDLSNFLELLAYHRDLVDRMMWEGVPTTGKGVDRRRSAGLRPHLWNPSDTRALSNAAYRAAPHC